MAITARAETPLGAAALCKILVQQSNVKPATIESTAAPDITALLLLPDSRGRLY
jgi:hypothetical protein